MFYHGYCPDGLGACYVMDAKWKETVPGYLRDQIKWIGLVHGRKEQESELIGHIKQKIPYGSEVYFMDYTPPDEVLDYCLKQKCRLTVYDHHDTVKESLMNIKHRTLDNPDVKIVFDDTLSGMEITFQQEFPCREFPPVVMAIGEGDRFADNPTLPGLTTYIDARLERADLGKSIGLLNMLNTTPLEEVVSMSAKLWEKAKQRDKEILDTVLWGNFTLDGEEIIIPVLVDIDRKDLSRWSGVNELARQSPSGLMFIMRPIGETGIVSTTIFADTSRINAAHVAEAIAGKGNGGGRTDSASFRLPLSDLKVNPEFKEEIVQLKHIWKNTIAPDKLGLFLLTSGAAQKASRLYHNDQVQAKWQERIGDKKEQKNNKPDISRNI